MLKTSVDNELPFALSLNQLAKKSSFTSAVISVHAFIYVSRMPWAFFPPVHEVFIYPYKNRMEMRQMIERFLDV